MGGLVACGGDDDSDGGSSPTPEPLISANVSGSAAGNDFVAEYGVSTVLESGTVSTTIGSGPLGCGDLTSGVPPDGVYVTIQIPEATVGVASETFFMFSVVSGSDLSGTGSNAGTVEVTAVSEETIAMDVDYADTVDNEAYSVSGDFEATRCP